MPRLLLFASIAMLGLVCFGLAFTAIDLLFLASWRGHLSLAAYAFAGLLVAGAALFFQVRRFRAQGRAGAAAQDAP